MKLLSLSILVAPLFAAAVFGQTPNPAQSGVATQCGPGEYVVQLNGKQVGAESFKVDCRDGGGYSISGTTTMDVGGAKVDLTTTLETDAKSVPTKFTMKGTTFGGAVDQTVLMKDGAATVTNNGATSTLSYTAGAAVLVNNVTYPFQWVTNRYDQTRGGVQEIVFFPNAKATMEFVGYDTPSAALGSVTAGPAPKFGRYLLQLNGLKIYVWTDAAGRAVVLANPGQKFAAFRKEYSPYSDALRALVGDAKPDYRVPADAPYTAEEVTVQAKGHTLAGTLLLPKNAKGPVPAVITITGSGQQTRDEPLPYPNLSKYLPFRQIALALAGRGIAVLRVDDRGVGDSTGLEGLNDSTTFDFADDTRAQVAFLRGRKEIDPDRIALVGHSEGGVIAPMVAADDPRIAAIVLLAGTGQRGDQVLLYQLNRPLDTAAGIPADVLAKTRENNAAMVRTAMEGGDTSKLPPILRVGWTKAFLNYDPLPAIRKAHIPVLIMQGALDQQVVPENAELLRKAAEEGGNHAVEVHVFPGLNHLFLPAITGDESEYSTITVQELSPEVMNTLTGWLVKTLKVR